MPFPAWQPDALMHAAAAAALAAGRGVRRVVRREAVTEGADARVSLLVDATPARLWEVLADGHRYADWVLGAKRVRAVDPDWPAVGASLHYTAGVGPLEQHDRTTVRTCRPEHLLELEVQAGLAGTARVFLRLQPEGARTRVVIDEHPWRGLARTLHTPLSSAAFAARNAVQVRRLRDLAERGSATTA